MTTKHLLLLLLCALIADVAKGQIGEELEIPVENDNEFPPEIRLDLDTLPEGSGDGAIGEPIDTLETTVLPILENIETISETSVSMPDESSGVTCPEKCSCHTEGATDNLTVDCSNAGLLEFPSSLDTRTITLNLQNNQLTEISKEISNLKKLQVLNVNGNEVMELQLGSISELPELKVLKLAKNRLIDYPQDLRNSIDLTKLEELDLGDNDMRTALGSDLFSNFRSLQKLVLPVTSPELLEGLCSTLKDTLQVVCTATCENQTHECPNAPQTFDEDMVPVIPGTIALSNFYSDNGEPLDNSNNVENEDSTDMPIDIPTNNEAGDTLTQPKLTSAITNQNNVRTADNIVPEEVADLNTPVDTNKDLEKSETDPTVGANTTKVRGGVDKSVIGLIAAGMVIIVAGILIKKNWGSIRKRFSSSPQANGRAATNGTTTIPEEVPLQEKDKSPV